MTRLISAAAAVLIAASAGAARAQSVTFPLDDLGGRLGTTNIGLILYDVFITNTSVGMEAESLIVVDAPNDDLAAGSYRVTFAITQANGAGTLQVTGNGVQTTCAINKQSSYVGPVQTCASAPVPVAADGKLSVHLQVVGNTPRDWRLGDVTVERLP